MTIIGSDDFKIFYESCNVRPRPRDLLRVQFPVRSILPFAYGTRSPAATAVLCRGVEATSVEATINEVSMLGAERALPDPVVPCRRLHAGAGPSNGASGSHLSTWQSVSLSPIGL